MATKGASRWANDTEDAELQTQRKKDREEKRRLKAEKQRKKDAAPSSSAHESQEDDQSRAVKRRKLSSEPELAGLEAQIPETLHFAAGEWEPCRHVDNFEKLNHIEEGSYGWVSRAKELASGEVVALKKLKMEPANDGFPVTGLREIQTLTACIHPNIVKLREVVMGNSVSDVFLVMDFLEHDLKTLQEEMSEPFLPSEIKTLLLQLSSAVEYLHANWILHRDLKTSNLLMNNRGQIKIADFGMARYYGDPPPKLTQLVVTLWYRAPELLLGAQSYGPEIDIWSIGCIFGELLTKDPLLQGKNEVSQLTKLCGVPTEETWPGFRRLPNARSLRLPRTASNLGNVIRSKFPYLTAAGSELLISLLSLDPSKRPSAAGILQHRYFEEKPRPKATEMFPTFPSKAGQEKRRRIASPNAPIRGAAPALDGDGTDFSSIFADREHEESGAGFSLRLV